MKLPLSIGVTALCCTLASAQSPMIRARFEPARTITVGEPVRLVVTVLVPNYFIGSPDFPDFDLQNAIVVLPQERPNNTSEKVHGVTYAGITEVYTLYPQQAGEFSLPPVTIDVSYANAPPRTTQAHLTLPALAFHADLPEAAKGLDYFLPTTRLTMQQRWSAPLQNLRAGDIVDRTITVTAAGMQAMLIPPLPFEAPDGLRVYQGEAAVEDVKSKKNDFLFGRRTQRAQYFIQKPGAYTLPAIELKWWNLSTREMVTAVLPSVHFEAAPNPGAQTELPPPEPTMVAAQPPKTGLWQRYRHQLWMALVGLTAAAFLCLIWLESPKMRRTIRDWESRRRQSEPAYFRSLRKASNNNDATAAYAALLRWLGRWSPGKSLDEAFAGSDNAALRAEIDQLGALLFATRGDNRAWNGRKMATLLKNFRKRNESMHSQKPLLATLNP